LRRAHRCASRCIPSVARVASDTPLTAQL
jgi:hypothetical protein